MQQNVVGESKNMKHVKSANRAGKGQIAESGVEWFLKNILKIPQYPPAAFFLNVGFRPQKKFFANISLSLHFYGKNTRVKNCSSENFLSNDLFNI